MSILDTIERPLCVAVIGSGPSGFYATEALLKEPNLAVRVDVFDRLPTPFGLVRGGVAPDHQKIKAVTALYEKVASDPRVRLFGNVKLGGDISVEDLRSRYDQIVYAVGCESDRPMGIPGEGLAGSFAATDLVGWYNGHPDHRHHRFDLSCEAVAIVGIGNVAMDVARILAQDPELLAKTDAASYAIDSPPDQPHQADLSPRSPGACTSGLLTPRNRGDWRHRAGEPQCEERRSRPR